MLRSALALSLLLAALPSVGAAQESLCNPCVDPRLRPMRPFEFSSPGARSVVTAEDMRKLGVISVADMIRQLPGNIAATTDGEDVTRAPTGRASITTGLRTRHFLIHGDYDGLIAPIAELGAGFDEVYEYVAARMGVPTDSNLHIPLEFVPPAGTGTAAGCPQRGRASPEHIEIFADASTSRAQLLGVLAHEIGHVLSFVWPAGYPASTMPGEGVATWAAGRYVTDWYGSESLGAAVAAAIAADDYAPISEAYGPYYTVPPDYAAAAPPAAECFANRDRLYTAWGAFIAYLIDAHGRQALANLFASRAVPEGASSLPDRPGSGRVPVVRLRPGTAVVPLEAEIVRDPAAQLDYAGVYGRSLAELEAAWLETLPGLD
jgi:hypothetical protein